MISLQAGMKIYLAVEGVDFRKGIDGLMGECRERLKQDPFSGGVFVFRNLGKTSLKILMYDGQGFWLCQKRLSQGRFKWWPGESRGGDLVYPLIASELQVLLWNGDPQRCAFSEPWKKI